MHHPELGDSATTRPARPLAGRRGQSDVSTRPRGGRPPRPRAVILAGGKGTRLAPLTTVLPKPLVPLGDGPILDVLLGQLRAQGWRQVALAVGHMADLIRTYCGSGARYGLKLRYMREQEPLGTVGPLAGLPSSLRDRSMLVMNGDLLTTLRFDDLIRAHAESGAIATLAVRRRRIEIEFGVVELDDMLDGPRRVVGYREKPDLEAVVSMGVYVLQAEVLDYIEPGERLDLPELIHRLLADRHHVAAYLFDGYWLDIGRHSDYQKALDDYESIKPFLAPAPIAP